MRKNENRANWPAFMLRPYVWPFWLAAVLLLAYVVANIGLTLTGQLPDMLHTLLAQAHRGHLFQIKLPNLFSGSTLSWLFHPHLTSWPVYVLGAGALGIEIIRLFRQLRRAADPVNRGQRQ